MQALRAQDYEAYLRLAESAKDRRLNELLEMTDQIVAQLGRKVSCCLAGLHYTLRKLPCRLQLLVSPFNPLLLLLKVLLRSLQYVYSVSRAVVCIVGAMAMLTFRFAAALL